MEVKVNVINEMKKLRDTTYSDRDTWVEEVVQNCQRSHATHIDVIVEPDCITVSDNGCGCKDPQVLFDKSSSGWDEDVSRSENPFGEGFFSTMMAADKITVKSVGFTAYFDVNKMFELNTVDCIDVVPNRKQSGFTLTLSNLRNGVYMHSIIDRFKRVGRYIKSPTMTINGERVKYEGLDPKEESPFIHKFSNDLIKGWIIPDCYSDRQRNWNERPEVACFAFSRAIKTTTKFSGVRGVVTFNENAITLRSPDRKEFVYDEKYTQCVKAFRDEIKKMYIKFLKIGSDEMIAAYDGFINNYVSVDEYRKFIKFKKIESEKKSEEDICTGTLDISDDTQADTSSTADDPAVVTADNAADDNDTVTDSIACCDSDDTDCSSDNDPGDDFAEDVAQANNSAPTPDSANDFSASVAASPISEIKSATLSANTEFDVTTDIVARDRLAAQTSTPVAPKRKQLPRYVSEQTGEAIDDIQYGFYLRESELIQYKETVQIAQYYDIPVLIIRNNLEQEVIDTDDRFRPISEMPSMISLNAEYRRPYPITPQEERAAKLLSRVARAMNMDENMFIIADTEFQKILHTDDGEDHIIETIDVMATAYDGKIYINRKHLSAHTDLSDDSNSLTPADLKFLLLNVETLAHEMAHAVYNTSDNTLEHAEKTLMIMKHIINLIYGDIHVA